VESAANGQDAVEALKRVHRYANAEDERRGINHFN
jgi:hypothetical protein